MSKLLHVYPKAVLDSSTWFLDVKVFEAATRLTTRFTHEIPAGVVGNIRELKVTFNVVVSDTDFALDVDDALFVDDIKGGPSVETVWGNWQERAEKNYTPGMTQVEYWAEWSKQDTAKTRNDARRSLVTQRGWSVTAIHQHEGDGTNTDESS